MASQQGTGLKTLPSYVPQAVLRYVSGLKEPPTSPHAETGPAALLLIDMTGFTPVLASAVRSGAQGTEGFSRSFNTYLGRIIDLVSDHGGDITKFVGDALIPVWQAGDEDLPTATRRAAACGLAVIRELGESQDQSVRLSLKVGLCAGEVTEMHVGGLSNRWLFVIAGDAVRQLVGLQGHLSTGDVVATPEAWSVISDRFVGQSLANGRVVLRSTARPPAPRPLTVPNVRPELAGVVRSYIPPVLLSRLDAGQADWLSELRRTSVVFVNVREFAGESMTSLDSIDRLAKSIQRVATRYDGWAKEVTLDEKGTTLTLAFGIPPFTHEDDAVRAVNAAITLEDEIRAAGMGAGFGIATGVTFCGPVGNDHRHDLAVLGSHVNLAARLMQAADDGSVLVDGTTYEAARSAVEFDRLPAYVLRGLGTPTDVYRARPRSVQVALPMKLVDRTREMAAFSDALIDLNSGQGGLVIVEGEPGIGKSRLVSEWTQRARDLGLRPLVGEASEIEISSPYYAWRPVLLALPGFEGVLDRSLRATVARERLAAAGANPDLLPVLGAVLSLDLPDNELTSQLDAEARADNTRQLVLALLGQATRTDRLMVVLEDVHWLDSASWQLIPLARTELPDVLFVLTTRQIAEAPSDAVAALREHSTQIALPRFTRPDSVALAALRSGATNLDDTVATLVHERSEGNPLFIEQLTYALRDTGRIVIDRGTLRGTSDGRTGLGLDAAIIPDSVQRVITTRLDHLDPAMAMTLKVASVIGPRFNVRTLQDIHPVATPAGELTGELERLTKLGLVAPTSGPEPTFEFSHKTTQEVVYGIMPVSQSRELHRRLAEWYERAYADDLSPFLAFLAHHWRAAGEPARAVDYLELAGLEALRTFANADAIEFLEAADKLATSATIGIDPRRRARWLLAAGDAYVNLSRYREGRARLEQGLQLLHESPPTGRIAMSMALVGQLVRQLAHRLGLRRRRHVSEDGRDELVAVIKAYEPLGEAAYYDGNSTLALYSSIRVLNDAETSGSPAEMARGLAGTGALFGLAPLPRLAESYLRRADAVLTHVEDAPTHEFARLAIGFYFAGVGKWDRAREEFSSVRSTALRLGDRRRLLDATGNLLEIEYLQGSVGRALEMSDEFLSIARSRGDRRFEADGLVARAYALLELGRANEALRALEDVTEIGLHAELASELRIKTQGTVALVREALGDRATALSAANEAARLTSDERPTFASTFLGYVGSAEVYMSEAESSISAQASKKTAMAQVDSSLARLRRFAGVFPIGMPRFETLSGRRSWLKGDRRAAMQHWRRAVEVSGRLAMTYEAALALTEIGLHLDRGDADRRRSLAEAHALLGPLGAARRLALVQDAQAADYA